MARSQMLPLRYLRLETVFSTPADQAAVASKAIRLGTAPMSRLLDRNGISAAELAERLGVVTGAVEALIANPQPAGAVMLDGEDAVAGDRPADQATSDAAALLGDPGWMATTLRLWRPPVAPGEDLGPLLERLATALSGTEGAGSKNSHGRLDGVVMPKVARPKDVEGLGDRLADFEERLGWADGGVGVVLMVETARAVGNLLDVADAVEPRLSGLIFGSADYAAELGLGTGSGERAFEWARAAMVNAAAATGVPAIDAMTLDFPVVAQGVPPDEGREQFISRVALAYRDAVDAAGFGMTGKLVGHPAQLFAARLAFDGALAPSILEGLAAEIEAYEAAMVAGRGVTTSNGRMVDRATVSAARAALRKAVANGRFSPGRAVALGAINSDEVG